MKKSGIITVAAIAAFAMVAVSGCSNGAASVAPGDTPEAGAESNAPMPTVRYGIYEPGLDAGFLLMAQEKEFWKEQGVKVELTTFKSASEAFPAFLSGQVDVIQANPSEALLAADKGAELTFIGTTMPGMNYALYGNEKFDSVKDLAGATLGSSAPTALPSVVAKAMLMASGVDPESVKLVKSGGSPDRYAAVVNGVVDAASSPIDYVPRTEADGVKVLGLAKDIVPEYPRYALIAHNSFLEKSPDAAVGLLAGLAEGIRYALDNPDEAKALTAATVGGLKADDPAIEFAYNEFKDGGYLDSNVKVPVAGIKYLAELQVQVGISEKAVDVDPLVDESYQQKAMEKVGEVDPTYYGDINGG